MQSNSIQNDSSRVAR